MEHGSAAKTRIGVALMVGLLVGLPATAADLPNWAQKMFDAPGHDFGTVARAAKVEHRFRITNLYRQPVHIADVKTTCGCSAVRPTRTTLASGESAWIEVLLDTRRFIHRKDSVVTVVFDAPARAVVHLPIRVFIRTDVVLSPGSADFAMVSEGTAATRRIGVAYAGRDDWTIREVRNSSPHIAARVEETRRGDGRVDYSLIVELKASAPAGRLRERLVLVTDESEASEVPVLVEATIEPEFAISPLSGGVLPLGTLVAGRSRAINVVIKGREPFVIEKIACGSDRGAFRTRLPSSKRRVHVLPLSVIPPAGITEIRESFTITIAGRSKPLTFTAYGRVLPGR